MKTGNPEPTLNDDIDCPRCAVLRGKSVKMGTIKIGRIKTAYECRSCDYVIPLVQFDHRAP